MADFEKLKELLLSDVPSEMLNKYKSFLFDLCPEFIKCDGFEQQNPYHVYDVLTHIFKVVDSTPCRLDVRLAALFHDVGKPEKFTFDEVERKGHFYGHPFVSEIIFLEFAKRNGLDKELTDRVSFLIRHHEDTLSVKPTKVQAFVQKFDSECIESLFDLKIADIKGQNPDLLFRVEEMEKIRLLYSKQSNPSFQR